MSSKFPKTALNLKQFLLRQEVILLYREIIRTVKKVPDEKTKSELLEWARTDFRRNMDQRDEYTIKSLIRTGKKSLSDLSHSLALSKN